MIRSTTAALVLSLGLAFSSASQGLAKESHFQLSLAPTVQLVDAEHDISGLRLGIVSQNHHVSGLDIGLGQFTTGDFNGVSLSIANAVYGEAKGVQLGLYNHANRIIGAQVGWINTTKELTGLQVGALNIARQNDLLQIGILNIADNRRGWQIGAFNVNMDDEAYLPFMVIVNGSF